MIYNNLAKCIHQRRNKPSSRSPTLIATAGRRDGIQSCYSSSHSTVLFTNNDSKQSTADTIHHDPYLSNTPQLVDAHHWFTELLPEGWCVGVISGHTPSSSGMMMIDETTTTTTTATHVTTLPTNQLLLHPDEHRWGMDHIASDISRTSYYLGRMALRSSMSVLLDNYNHSQKNSSSMELADDDSSSNINSSNINHYTQLKDQIRNMAINKDTHGRPILPNIISGSISHKEGYAVGLSTFRSSTNNPIISSSSRRGHHHHPTTTTTTTINLDKRSKIAWQEECPLLLVIDDDDDNPSSTNDDVGVVHGVGIDLERIDGSRGMKIKKKVLTENELSQLGGLEAIGISCDEEVILRFSLKESVYKAMQPILCQYVGFHEAEITPLINGSAKVSLLQLVNIDNGRPPNNKNNNIYDMVVVHSASWKKIGNDFFLSSASVGTR